MTQPGHEAPLAARDAAAIRRSYGFVTAVSCGAWALLALVIGSVGVRDGGGAFDAAGAIVAATGVALLGWLLFLRGLRRRELARLEPPSATGYDPRS